MNAKFFLIFSLFVGFSQLQALTAQAKAPDANSVVENQSDTTTPKDDTDAPAINDVTESQKSNAIELNFQNASLANVLEYLVQEKGYNLIPPGKELQDKKVSLITKKSISLDQAWDVLNTLLEINGFRIVKYGRYDLLP